MASMVFPGWPALRSTTATAAPSSARRCAVAAPMPWAEPYIATRLYFPLELASLPAEELEQFTPRTSGRADR
ncbi:hypothetical protein ACFC4G_41500 [Streptomyces sp. NPDC056002]|uniref:hypothetical protein n=1 Tax=Streptomyces sp. NPDC056002 TaxID=3345675 RepID=UPI0035DC22C1